MLFQREIWQWIQSGKGPLLVIFALGMCYNFLQNTVSLQRKIFKRWNGKERQFVFIVWVYVGDVTFFSSFFNEGVGVTVFVGGWALFWL